MRIYFSGLGGVAIGPLAEIALDAGYTALGSERAENLMTKQLEQRGVLISPIQDGSFLETCHQEEPIDWLIYTAALPDNHPELVKARQLGIKVGKRDELLAHIISQKQLKLIAISGTHGKTTTTGMLVWVLKQLGIPISYSVGTTLSWGPSGIFDPASEYFIYECDEFDRNFLHFSPYLSLITSIDYDHIDTYPTKDDYDVAFGQFLAQSSHSIGWKHDFDQLPTLPDTTWQLRDDEVAPIKTPGAHNRRNGSLVLKSLEYLGLSTSPDQLDQFPGTNRRFEKLGENLYSDYGHHPIEIAATLQLAREVSDHIVLVYQPHQNVRQHKIKDEYIDCFELAETTYWLPTYLSREYEELPVLPPEALIQNITNRQSIEVADMNSELWAKIQAARRDGKLVLCMGAGSIDDWVRKQLS
jgi:UDP-N-acetylmuramate--alanine ligase